MIASPEEESKKSNNTLLRVGRSGEIASTVLGESLSEESVPL